MLPLLVVASPGPFAAQTTLARQFEQRLLAQYRALAQADTAALGNALADCLVWTVGTNGAQLTKAQLLAAASHRQTPTPRFEIDSVRVRRLGDVAVVDYRRGDARRLGGYQLTTWTRAVDVFSRRGARWRLEHHAQTWLVAPVTPVEADSTDLEAFVGRYQIGPGYVDSVHWERGQLVATASGQSAGALLVPVSASAFSPNGVGALIVFERDASGRVVGYVQGLPNGGVVRGVRLR